MDKITEYRNIVMDELNRYAERTRHNKDNPYENEVVFDTQRDRYQVLAIGWPKDKRVFSPIFHIEIINGKIWVQQNMSDYDIVGELEARGIPKSDIVLAFHSPYMRQFTGYAVA